MARYKRNLTLRLHPELIRRAEDSAVLQNRSVISIYEIALAEYLHVPLADPAFPAAPVEICHKCRNAVMGSDRCPACHWRRPRPARARL